MHYWTYFHFHFRVSISFFFSLSGSCLFLLIPGTSVDRLGSFVGPVSTQYEDSPISSEIHENGLFSLFLPVASQRASDAEE